MQRLTKHQYYAEIAQVVAKRSTCPKLRVGAVLVSEHNSIISTGYNGAPRWGDHCSDVGCRNDDAGHCTRAVHAEANVIAQAAANGVSTRASTMYITHCPCVRCLNLIVNAGTTTIFYLQDYKVDHSVLTVAREAAIHLNKLEF